MLAGTDGVQDTFVFDLALANNYGDAATMASFDPLLVPTNASGADMLGNFNPADGDEIVILSGGQPMPPAGAGQLLGSLEAAPGQYAIYMANTSLVVFTTNDADLVPIASANFSDDYPA